MTLMPRSRARATALVYSASVTASSAPRYVPMPSDEITRCLPSRLKCSAGRRPPKRAAYRAVPPAVAYPSIIAAIMRKAARVRSSFSVDEKEGAHGAQTPDPEPAGATAGFRQSQLEPAAPAREGAEDAERGVGDLGEE